MESVLFSVIGGLLTILCAVVGFMLRTALLKIGILETSVSKCVTQEKCDKLQFGNTQEFKSIYKHSDDKFNQLMTVIKSGNDKQETKLDNLADKLNEHLINHHA